MGVRNCRKCGRVFNYFSGLPICAACKEGMEKKFQDVKKFIRENPHADMKEISVACEVEVQQIHQWVREERLEFTEDSPIKLPCESCGTMIRAGKFCNRCKDKMAKNLSSVIDKPKPAPEPVQKPKTDGTNKMRFLDRH